VGRIVAGVVAVTLLVLAVRLFSEASKVYQWFRELGKAEPVNMEVDFSKPGRYLGLYRKKYYCPHGVWLHLKSDQGASSEEKTGLGKLEGLEGKISVIDSNGQVVMTQDFTDADFFEGSFSEEGGACPTLRVDFTLKEGDFRLAVDVVEAAVGLKNTHQILKARYVMCGIDVLPAAIMRLTGVVAGGVGVTIIAVIVVRALKRRKKTSINEPSNAAE
jgi:hypothetical protein